MKKNEERREEKRWIEVKESEERSEEGRRDGLKRRKIKI